MKPTDKLIDSLRILPTQEKGLKKLSLETVRAMLYHFPTRYGDGAYLSAISDLTKGEQAVVFGKISGLKTSKAFRKKIPMAEAWIEDIIPPTSKASRYE